MWSDNGWIPVMWQHWNPAWLAYSRGICDWLKRCQSAAINLLCMLFIEFVDRTMCFPSWHNMSSPLKNIHSSSFNVPVCAAFVSGWNQRQETNSEKGRMIMTFLWDATSWLQKWCHLVCYQCFTGVQNMPVFMHSTSHDPRKLVCCA